MTGPRVDLWDPTPEGPWIVEHLRQEGFDVRTIPLAEVVLTRSDLVIMAADVDGALPALKLLRDEGLSGDVPVILVGVPDGLTHHGEGPAFGADAVFTRPVALDPLLRCAQRLVGDAGPGLGRSIVTAPPERTLRLSGDGASEGGAAGDAPPSSQVLSVRGGESWRPREPTLQLRDGPIPPSAVVPRSGGSSIPPRTSTHTRAPTGTGSRPGTGPHVAAEVPEPQIPPEARARLSPWLEELLRAADRRVFPDRPSLALHFAAAQEPPDVLVPAELLELAPFRIDEPVVDDPIDAFTYVGGPAVPLPLAPASPSDEPPAPSETPREQRKTSPETPARVSRSTRHEDTTGVEVPAPLARSRREVESTSWPDDDTVLGRATPDGTRRGALGKGGALRLLWRIAALGLDGMLTIACEGGPTVRMTFLAGELRAFGGPVAQLALESLRQRGRAIEAPADEAGADAVLQRRVELGELGRFERDRLLREAHERLLERVVHCTEATFVLRRLEDTEPGRLLHGARVLARPLRAALVEAARSLSTDEVLELVGPEPVGVALGPDREVGLAPAELPFELCELLVRMEGRALDELLAAAPTEPGLAGVVFALVAGDVLVLTDPPKDARPSDEARAAVRTLLEAAAALALDGDYFAILGVGRQASQREVERAHAARRDELASIPLGLLGLSALEDARREALDALDEALFALRSTSRRAAYAAALD